MKKNLLYTILLLTSIFTYSCSTDVDFGEQYKKAVYIVNSKDVVYYAKHQAISDSKGNISFYVSGTELPKNDIHVKYTVDEGALATYNNREYGENTNLYFDLLPSDKYTFDNQEVVIKKNNAYGYLNFTINVTALDPSKTYILPISIASVEGAEKSERLNTILYVIQISNEYAGSYLSTYYYDNSEWGFWYEKNIIALSAKKVLVPLGDKNNGAYSDPLKYETDFYQMIINDDNSLTIIPYLQSEVYEDEDNRSYYNPDENTFYVYYKIKDKYDDIKNVKEEIARK